MSRRPKHRSISTKFFLFTASLVFWVVAVTLAYDLREDNFDWAKGVLLFAIVFLVSSAIARMTTRVLTRPLAVLQEGIRDVEAGRLDPIAVSPTGDEIEDLGHAFNRMVATLAATRSELLQHQETLEEKIRQRTHELEVAMQQAMAASAAKGEFLANMSHELRTPMNGVLGMIDMVLASPLSPEQRDQLETAHSCAYALLALLNDVLDLSRIEAGRMTLESVPFDLHNLLEDTARAHAVVSNRKGVPLRTVFDPQLPRVAQADPLRLRQIVANLLSNAVKFTDSGEIVLEAAPKHSGPLSFDLRIRVRDTGMGIDPTKLEHIFEKFTQADGSITRKFGGSGLGLCITRRLVEQHGGTITVESHPGTGSTFTVTVPYAVPETEPAPLVERAGPTVLVVDDNAVNRRMVSAILARRGFRVRTAANGREALTELEAGGVDAVLMDLQMPEIDGLELTRIIRRSERFCEVPVVGMSAHGTDGDQQQYLGAGMNAYISKPVHAVNLLHTLDRVLAEQPLATAQSA